LGRPTFRAALIRTSGNQHRFVLTLHHIVVDGWSLPILLQEIFASYFRQRLPAAPIAASSPGWPGRIATPRTRRGARCSRVSTPRRWWPRRRRRVRGRWTRSDVRETTALADLARAQHTTVNTVLQAGWAQVLMMLTGQQDVAFGTAVSGGRRSAGRGLDRRPVDQHRAGAGEHDRDHHGRRPARPVAAPPQRHPRARARGPDRDPSPHRHDQLFDTLLSRELPDRSQRSWAELAVTDFTSREYNHYPLSVCPPGDEMGAAGRVRHRCLHRPASPPWSTGSSTCSK
jgi:glycopeptidolipid biosynthesis protein